MATLSHVLLDTLFAGYLSDQPAVPDDEKLQAMARQAGTDVETVKNRFADKWRAAGNLDDPFGRHPKADEDDEQ